MFKLLNKALSSEKIDAIEQQVTTAAEARNEDAAWKALQPMMRAQRHQREAAECVVRIVKDGHLSLEHSLSALADTYDSNKDDNLLVASIGAALESARDIDQLNAAPPEHPLFLNVVDQLAAVAETMKGQQDEAKILDGLSSAARMVARQRDEIAERSYKRLVEIDPTYSAYHYNLGLFYKTRGRFKEGMQANQVAASLASEAVESYEWNLGICATGAGEGAIALNVWKRMSQKIEMGRFDLPDGGYPQCKVKLAERPLAERGAGDDDPGQEETIWIQRLSPCHGIIRSVLYNDLGVDFGDVVLIDGAPITYHTYGDKEVPVFPHLATLVRSHYQFYDFAGTQQEAGQLESADAELERDSAIYSHTENVRTLCANCWRDPDIDHEEHIRQEKHVVTGKIAAPPDIPAQQLLDQLDKAVAGKEACSIYAPDLCEAAGLSDRARVERRRFEMLKNN
ncbi:MAG: hypothetical protein WBN09_05975 [Woeseiaceae bacterium]